MNAKQIADELENIYWIQGDGKGKPFQQYADFVRQQQAEIEALKLQLHTTLTNRDLRTYDGKLDINNEPVAWMEIEYGGFTEYKVWREPVSSKSIPLYTHPAKTLTDEEIMVLYEEYIETQYASESNVLGFGRAILRKAQEK